MKTPEERKKHAWTVVAIVGGGGVVLLVLASSARAPVSTPSGSTSGTQRQVAPHSLNFGPNPATPALDESLIAAREAALNTYDQSAVAERSITDQYLLGLNQDATARAVAFNTNATQLKETGITTTAAQAIAEEEAQAQQAIATAQAQAQVQAAQAMAAPAQTQAQGGFWSSILGGIGSIIPFLGGL